MPDAVIPSQRDANKAQADKERYILEAEAYANGIMPVAQGAAARMQQDAQAYKAQVTRDRRRARRRASRSCRRAYAQAPEVTRQRLYMDTIESVLARAHKVLDRRRSARRQHDLPAASTSCWSKSSGREVEPSRPKPSPRPARQGARTR